MIDDGPVDRGNGSSTRTLHHEGNGAIATTLVLAIAEMDDIDPSEMAPLYGSVDPNLLETLYSDDHQITGDVMFTYRGHRITVDSDGGILINPGAAEDSA